MFLEFVRVLRDAVFIINEGDRRGLDAFLRENRNSTFEKLLDEDPDFVFQHVRRKIPEPSVLAMRIGHVFAEYKAAIDTKTGFALFPREMDSIVEKAMIHVSKGCLSDPPGIELYYEIESRIGLTRYRCVRGTNSNEGTVHKDLRGKFGANNAGPRLTFCFLLDFAARVNMKAAVRNKGEKDYGHQDPWLLDELAELYEKLDSPAMDDWLSSTKIDLTVENHPFFIMGPIFEPGTYPVFDEEIAKTFTPSMRFVAERTDMKIPLMPIHSKEEMALFKKLESDFDGNLGLITDRWNAIADGITIFSKTRNLLQKHVKVRDRVRNRESTLQQNPVVISHMPLAMESQMVDVPAQPPLISLQQQLQVENLSIDDDIAIVSNVQAEATIIEMSDNHSYQDSALQQDTLPVDIGESLNVIAQLTLGGSEMNAHAPHDIPFHDDDYDNFYPLPQNIQQQPVNEETLAEVVENINCVWDEIFGTSPGQISQPPIHQSPPPRTRTPVADTLPALPSLAAVRTPPTPRQDPAKKYKHAGLTVGEVVANIREFRRLITDPDSAMSRRAAAQYLEVPFNSLKRWDGLLFDRGSYQTDEALVELIALPDTAEMLWADFCKLLPQ